MPQGINQDGARTSDRVSKIAGRYIGIDEQTLLALTVTPSLLKNTAADIRALAASALRQDEHKGLRGLLKRITG